MLLHSNPKSMIEIKRGFDLVSTGLLYLDQNRRVVTTLHGKKALRAIDAAEKAVSALQLALEALKKDRTDV